MLEKTEKLASHLMQVQEDYESLQRQQRAVADELEAAREAAREGEQWREEAHGLKAELRQAQQASEEATRSTQVE
jgi:seryl-tRNA synthetase